MEGFDLDVLSAAEQPWFSALLTGHGVITGGTKQCLLGHRLGHASRDVADGIFVEWAWDGNRLRVSNDRYGIYPLFYTCHGKEIRISPSIQHVLKGHFPKDLNYPALAVFLRLGFFVGDDTPFEHVHVLPPASTLTWRDGRLDLERGPIESRMPPDIANNFDDAVDQYAELFRQAIARRPPERPEFTVPISGGRDSRHILFELLAQGHTPDLTVTVKSRPPSANEDIRIARMLAESLDLQHTEIDMPASFFKANLKDIELTHFCGSGHTWLLPVASYLKGRTETLYDGLAGSVLSGGFQVNERKIALFKEGALTELAEVLLGESRVEGFLVGTLRGEVVKQASKSVAVERLAAELEHHQDKTHPLVSYIFWNRTRRYVSLIPFSILAHVPTVHCPYLDHDVFDFLMNLDARFSLGNAMHDETIRRTYPQHADLPFEDKNAPRPKDQDYSAYYRRAVRDFAGYLARRPGALRSGLVRSDRVLLRMARDLLRRRNDGAWYLRPALYALELERAAR